MTDIGSRLAGKVLVFNLLESYLSIFCVGPWNRLGRQALELGVGGRSQPSELKGVSSSPGTQRPALGVVGEGQGAVAFPAARDREGLCHSLGQWAWPAHWWEEGDRENTGRGIHLLFMWVVTDRNKFSTDLLNPLN